MDLTFATSNVMKFQIGQRAIRETAINLLHKSIRLDEIQDEEGAEIARMCAISAYQVLCEPVAVTDASFIIPALNGFPGPFVKYVNKYLNPEDILRLMDGKEDRRITIRESLCIATGTKSTEQLVYSSDYRGRLSEKVGMGNGTTFEKLVIPEGYGCCLSEMAYDDQIRFWSSQSAFLQINLSELSELLNQG